MELHYWHLHHIRYSKPIDFDVLSSRLQACAVTFRASGFAAIAIEHYTILYAVGFALHKAEKSIYSGEVVVSMPQKAFLLLGEIVIWSVDWEPVFRCF